MTHDIDFEAGTFVNCTFSMDDQGRGEVSFDVNDNDPDSEYAAPQSIYGSEIRALALFLLQCCEQCDE